MTICSVRNDNLLSRCVYSDILNRKFPPKKPFRPENSDCAECVTFSLPRIKFNLSSGVFERRTATGSKTSSLFICLDATKTNKLSSHVCVYFREVFQHLNILVYTNFLFFVLRQRTVEFPGFCATRHLAGGRESSYVG